MPKISTVDQLYSPGRAGECALSVHIASGALSWCLLDSKKNTYLALTEYSDPSIDPSGDVGIIRALCESDSFLSAKYKTVNVAIATPVSTLVPTPLFSEKEAVSCLRFNHSSEEEMEIRSDDIRIIDAKNVYGVGLPLISALQTLFPGAVIRHHATSLIEGLLLHYKDGLYVIAHLQPSYVDIVVADSKKLRLYNTFRYQTPEDFIYFILFVYEQLQMDPEQSGLILLGDILPESPHTGLAKRYIRDVRLGDRNDIFNYGYCFSELPSQRFYNLLSQNLCV